MVLPTFVCAALALALAFALSSAFREGTAEAISRAAGQEAQSALEVISSPSDDTALGVQGSDGKLTQTVNGMEISVSNARFDGQQVKLDVCYDRPDSGNWLIRGVTLQYGGTSVSGFSANPIELRDPPINGQQKVTTFDENGNTVEKWEAAGSVQKGRRCDTPAFDVAPRLGDTSYILTISSIRALPNEGAECEVVTKVQAALDARNLGIRLNCMREEWGVNVTIASKPDSMSQDEAEKMAFSVRDEFFSIKGPWTFTGNLK